MSTDPGDAHIAALKRELAEHRRTGDAGRAQECLAEIKRAVAARNRPQTAVTRPDTETS